MIPPTVEKRVKGELGAAVMWASPTKSFKNSVASRARRACRPPAAQIAAWMRQVTRAKMFDNLIGNLDPNLGNWLVDPAWNLIVIDHTRAFTPTRNLYHDLVNVDQELWDKMKALDEAGLTTALGEWLDKAAIRGIPAAARQDAGRSRQAERKTAGRRLERRIEFTRRFQCSAGPPSSPEPCSRRSRSLASRRRCSNAPPRNRRAWRPRDSRWIRCGPSHSPTTGCWAMPSASGSTIRMSSGSSIAGRPRSPTPRRRSSSRRANVARAPPVLAFDASGSLARHWGGPRRRIRLACVQPRHLRRSPRQRVIGGNGPGDSHIVKFTKDGKFLAQYGKPGARRVAGEGQTQPSFTGGSHDPANFGRVAKIFVDPKTNEAFLADGYLNKRVAVLDGKTGALKRYWGAYGGKPDDANSVHKS